MKFLREAWVVVQVVAKILNYSRFSLIIVLITVFSLETIGQIKDILVGLGPLGSNLKAVFFVLAVNWLAFQSWGWARHSITAHWQAMTAYRKAQYPHFLEDK